MERLLRRLDFAALASVFSQQAKRVYTYQVWDRETSPIEFRGQDLFGQTAVLLYEDLFFFTVRWTSLCLRTADRAYEIWLKEDGSLVTVSRMGVNYDRGEFRTEFREIRGYPYVCGLELNLDRLTEELLVLCGDESDKTRQKALSKCAGSHGAGSSDPVLKNKRCEKKRNQGRNHHV